MLTKMVTEKRHKALTKTNVFLAMDFDSFKKDHI